MVGENLKSESFKLFIFSGVSITALYFSNQKKNPEKQKRKHNKENLEYRFNFHLHLFLLKKKDCFLQVV